MTTLLFFDKKTTTPEHYAYILGTNKTEEVEKMRNFFYGRNKVRSLISII